MLMVRRIMRRTQGRERRRKRRSRRPKKTRFLLRKAPQRWLQLLLDNFRQATPPTGRSVSLSPLDSIFNSDNEVDAALPSQPRGSESGLSPLIVVAGTKRKKRMISSSSRSPDDHGRYMSGKIPRARILGTGDTCRTRWIKSLSACGLEPGGSDCFPPQVVGGAWGRKVRG